MLRVLSYARIACQRMIRLKESDEAVLLNRYYDNNFFKASKQGFMKILSAHIVIHRDRDGKI